MKKMILSVLATLCLMMTTSFASASEVVLFKNASGQGWTAFEKDLKADGLLKDDTFPTAVLAQIAHAHAKKESLPAGKLGEKEFKNLFLLANNLGENITVAEFQKLGQAGKIVLSAMVERQADVTSAAPAVKPEVVAPAAVVAATIVSAAPSVADTASVSIATAQAGAIANLEGRLNELQAKVAKSGGDQKQVAALAAAFKPLQEQVRSLSDRQAGLAQKGEVGAAVKAETIKIGNDLKTAAAAFQVLEGKLDARLTVVEADVGKQGKYFVWLATGMTLVILAMVVNWRRTTAVKQVSAATLTKVKEVEGDLEAVHGQIGKLNIQIPNNLVEKLQALKLGDSHSSVIEVEGEGKILDFIKVTDGVKITGIVSQHNPVRIDNVIKRIKRAAGQGHLIGIPQEPILKSVA